MRWLWAAAVVLGAVSWSAAQDQASPDELNHKYQDALTQLKAAQDRKNELATENDRLNAKLAELEKQIAEANRQAAGFAERTFQLRSNYAAWQSFLKRYPHLLEKWNLFIESDPLAAPADLPDLPPPATTAPSACCPASAPITNR